MGLRNNHTRSRISRTHLRSKIEIRGFHTTAEEPFLNWGGGGKGAVFDQSSTDSYSTREYFYLSPPPFTNSEILKEHAVSH